MLSTVSDNIAERVVEETHKADAHGLDRLLRYAVADRQRRVADRQRKVETEFESRRVLLYEAVPQAQLPDSVSQPLLGDQEVGELDRPCVRHREPVLFVDAL